MRVPCVNCFPHMCKRGWKLLHAARTRHRCTHLGGLLARARYFLLFFFFLEPGAALSWGSAFFTVVPNVYLAGVRARRLGAETVRRLPDKLSTLPT